MSKLDAPSAAISRKNSTYIKDRLQSGLHSFIKHESFGGILLFFCVGIAMFLANTPKISDFYFSILEFQLGFTFNDSVTSMTLIHLINDVLMSLFFLMVGLEMKREVLYGDLAGFKKVSYSFFAAMGGICVPILIYLFFNRGEVGHNGFGVAMSTDTAFVLGVILLLGRRIPNVIKIFLVTLAVVDDLGAVVVVAIFYTETLNTGWILISCGILMLLAYINFRDTKHIFLYSLFGVALWICVYKSGIHPTVAAVLLSFFIPGKARVSGIYFGKMIEEWGKIDFDEVEAWRAGLINTKRKNFFYSLRDALANFINPGTQKQVDIARASYYTQLLDRIGVYSEKAQNPLLKIEHFLQPLCSYLIVPLFALANGGVKISEGLNIFSHDITFGVVLGLVLGKPIGIFLFAWLSERLNIAIRPRGLSLGHVFGVGALAGIGFTMSMFVSTLAYANQDLVDISKLSTIIASIFACVIGIVILVATTRAPKEL